MSSPTSGSERSTSAAFELLHPRMQRWVHSQGWATLHDAQEQAAAHIMTADSDVIITAATAAGKTEAAFLPIVSRLLFDAEQAPPVTRDPWTAHDPWAPVVEPAPSGVQVLYLSPLKALINDQFDRLEQMCESADVAVHRWHGDVSSSAKHHVLKAPSGVLLITPESLEATFVNRGTQIPGLFAGLRYIVVDELHSFLSTPRGAQLQSLMGRVELAVRRRVARVGLSATLGDMDAAAAFLRPSGPERVVVVSSTADSRPLQLQLRGYVTPPAPAPAPGTSTDDALDDSAKLAITDHMFAHLRGTDNLVFANARRDVETFAELLARRSGELGVPNEFWPHHGSLSKEIRESVEELLKDPTRPTTAVCTSTLEMGIDIGTVSSVAQIGPPPSVASMRQRVGRSGRRDEPAVLRLYVTEPAVDERSHPVDELRCAVVQSAAMVELMLERWLEAPTDPGFNYSTLVQQVLSTIAQHGGATAVELFGALGGPGPFALVDEARFVRLLRAMAAAELVEQAADGLLLHGGVGERFVNDYAFYAAFQTSAEWRLTTGGRPLGTVPIDQPLYVGVHIIFAGKRWVVTSIDTSSRVVDLERSSGGAPPVFGGARASVSDRVRARMAALYASDDVPVWLDRGAKLLLAEGRGAWRRLRLDEVSVFDAGAGVLVFGWVGDVALSTAAVALRGVGLAATAEGPSLEVLHADRRMLRDALDTLLAQGPPEPAVLAALLENRDIDKWDWVLDEVLACEAAGARQLDVDGAWQLFEAVHAELAGSTAAVTPPAMPSRPPAPFVAPPDSTPPPAAAPLPPPPAAWSAPAAPPQAAVPQVRLHTVELLEHEFCVVDVETTGFSTRLRDRVIEVAAVRVRADGTVVGEWSTLVNPGRDVGPTHVHGITAGDVFDAPRFADVIGDLLACMDGAVLVAHNLRFDYEFLSYEFGLAGVEFPRVPALCTLSLGSLVHAGGPSRRLDACCAQLGIELADAHCAAADAAATSQVLACYLASAVDQGKRTLADVGAVPHTWPAVFPQVAPSGRRCARGEASGRVDLQGQYLAGLVACLEVTADSDADTAAYLSLLDRALEDRRLSAVEAEVLADTAVEWGLTADAVCRVHDSYFDAVLVAASADGVITELEYRDLLLVGSLLQLDRDVVERRINDAELSDVTAGDDVVDARMSMVGMSVCFTGALVGRIDGELITRAQAQQFAAEAGLVVKSSVTKGLDVLVVADPDSQSGKARKAHDQGTRVIAEQVFWSSIGVITD